MRCDAEGRGQEGSRLARRPGKCSSTPVFSRDEEEGELQFSFSLFRRRAS